MTDKDKLSKKVWEEYFKTRKEALRDHLITHYLYLVKIVVSRLMARFPPQVCRDDLYSTGVMGLIKAVERFDPERKAKFESYAMLLIKGAIIDEMRSLDWVPRSVHQKAQEVERALHRLQQSLGREPTDQEMAKELKISLEDYEKVLLRVQPAVMLSLDKNTKEDSDDLPFSEKLADEKARTSFEVADRKEFNQLLEEAVLQLPDQEKNVLVLYYYENLMLKEIGKLMGLTESRVSQIHTKALLRLRTRLKDFIKEFSSML